MKGNLKMKIRPLLAGLAAGILIMAMVVVLLHVMFEIVWKNQIYPGVSLKGLDGVNNNKAKITKAKIESIFNNYESKPLRLVYADKYWLIKKADLGFDCQAEKSYELMYSVGREREWLKKWTNRLKGLRQKIWVKPECKINYQKMAQLLIIIKENLDKNPRQPKINLDKNQKLIIDPGADGIEVFINKTAEKISKALYSLDTRPVAIVYEAKQARATNQQIERAKNLAQTLLNKKLKIVYNNKSWELKDELLDFVGFQEKYNSAALALYVKKLAGELDEEAKNAQFEFRNGKVDIFKPSSTGKKLRQGLATKEMLALLEQLETSKMNIVWNIEADVDEVQPLIQTGDINNLGIRELLGQGVSYYKGSIASRKHNIALAASRLDGLIIKPEEEFSFNKALGDVSKKTGYKTAYIIKSGRTVLGDGGGVCQVSTTLFRAVLNAGLRLTERQPHAYRVSYYEQNSEPGLDATVYDPHPDLRFINDSPAYLLLQANVDEAEARLVIDIYGTSDGRVSLISKTKIWDLSPPPEALIEDDPSLPSGTLKQVDWPAWGAKTSFSWKVMRAGKVLREKVFYSYYKPWRAVYLRGTAK